MLLIQCLHKRIVAKSNHDGECTVFVVGNEFLIGPRRNIVISAKPLGIPPAVGDTHLIACRIGGRVPDVECTGLNLGPYIFREGGDTLIVAVVAFEREAIYTAPADCTVTLGIFIGPEDVLHNFHVAFAAAFNPYILFKIQGDKAEPGTGEQQMPFVNCSCKVSIAGKVDCKSPGSVFVVGEQIITGLEIIGLEAGIPPTSGYTDLRIFSLDNYKESLGLDPIPDCLRELCDALLTVRIGVVALKAEAVDAAPVDLIVRVIVGPERYQLLLPVTAFGTRCIGEFRQRENLTVDGVEFAHPGALEDVGLGDDDYNCTGTLAIEGLVLYKLGVAICIEEFHLVDEFEVGTENGELFTAGDLFSCLLGETGNLGVSYAQ